MTGSADKSRGPARVSHDLSVDSSALAMATAVARKDISARELMDLHLARIAERNPELNAIVSPSTRSGRGRAHAPPTNISPAAPRSGRCTVCRSP